MAQPANPLSEEADTPFPPKTRHESIKEERGLHHAPKVSNAAALRTFFASGRPVRQRLQGACAMPPQWKR